MNVEQFQLHQSERLTNHQLGGSTSEKISESHSKYNPMVVSSAADETMLLQRKDGKITAGTKSAKGSTPTIASDKLGKAVDAGAHLSNQPLGLIVSGYCVACTHFCIVSHLLSCFSIQFPI